MTIKIEVSHNLGAIEAVFSKFSKSLTVPATRRALNRAMITTRKEALREMTKHIRIKQASLRKRHIFGNPVRKGGSLKSMYSSVKFSGNPVPLIAFVKGAKKPAKLKGIAVKDRKAISVEVTPGRKIKLRHAFITKVKTRQVFKRSAKGRSPLKKQGVPSVAQVATSRKRGIIDLMRKTAQNRFQEVFATEMEARLQRKINKPKRKRFKKA